MSQYFLIEDFKGGLSSTRSRISAKAGTLYDLRNAHITRGGEIERRKSFALYAQLPSEVTFGLHAANNILYTFGSVATPDGMPGSINYQQLVHPTGANMVGLIQAENFNGGIYAIAQFDDGSIYHYYGGNRVTSWDAIVTTVANNDGVASGFASNINQDANFTATSLGSVITITERTVNIPFTVTVNAAAGGAGAPTIVTADTQAASGSDPQISTVTIGGTFDTQNVYYITLSVPSISYSYTYVISGEAAGIGTIIKTFGTKMYAEAASLLYFSQINDPTQWGIVQTSGSGFINMANQDAGSDVLTGLGVYQGKMAVFARRTIQLWSMNADPTQNVKTQTLDNIGTFAPRSVVSVGDLNLFFLSDNGIRSLVPRDASGNATTSDTGTNIDTYLQEQLQNLSPTIQAQAVAIQEPKDGRYWLVIGPLVYVYSYFPAAEISAWSVYEPGFNITHMVYNQGLIYVREGDNVRVYGGTNGNTYDDCLVTAILPFLDTGKPANKKTVRGVDSACENDWDVYLGTDCSNPDAMDFAGTLYGQSYSGEKVLVESQGTHIGVKMVCKTTGYARISNIAIHYDDQGP